MGMYLLQLAQFFGHLVDALLLPTLFSHRALTSLSACATSPAPAASMCPPESLPQRTGTLPSLAPLSCQLSSSVNLQPPRGCRRHPRSGGLPPRSLPPYRNTWPRPQCPRHSPQLRQRLPPRR